jgi:hypothetical protein
MINALLRSFYGSTSGQIDTTPQVSALEVDETRLIWTVCNGGQDSLNRI